MELLELAGTLRQSFFQGADGLVYKVLLEYDRLVASVTGHKPVQRFSPQILKQTSIWRHMARMVTLAQSRRVEPLHFLRAQFESFPEGERPYPPMLYSDASLRRYSFWLRSQSRKYKDVFSDIAEVQEQKADPLKLVRKALKVGQQQWEQMGRPNLGAVALNMANMLPAYFLLTAKAVEVGVREGTFTAPTLVEALETLEQVPAAWMVIRTWNSVRESAAA